jgi:acetate CoA/acetoacetate CoA-transferase alpha subunit
MIEKKILTADEAIKLVKPGQTVMIGGFMGCGTPPELIKSLRKSEVKDLTMVSNDCGWYDAAKGLETGPSINVLAKQFSHVITSHIGLNPEIQRQMIAGETEVTLVPQGTLAERIRSAGCGLGGVLTPTGVGTEVEEGKQVIELDGTKYLLEKGLKGDVALIHAIKADKAGNLMYARSARNFCPLMAMACKTVIVEAEEIVEIGELDPECVVTPSVFTTILVQGKGEQK